MLHNTKKLHVQYQMPNNYMYGKNFVKVHA